MAVSVSEEGNWSLSGVEAEMASVQRGRGGAWAVRRVVITVTVQIEIVSFRNCISDKPLLVIIEMRIMIVAGKIGVINVLPTSAPTPSKFLSSKPSLRMSYPG